MKATLAQLVEDRMHNDNGGFADYDLNDRFDGVDAAMEELTDRCAHKYAAFETKFEDSFTQLTRVSESKRIESETALASKLHAFEASLAISLQEHQTAELNAIIDKKVHEGVKDLLLGALKAAVIPLAENFEVRMTDFEQKMNIRLQS